MNGSIVEGLSHRHEFRKAFRQAMTEYTKKTGKRIRWIDRIKANIVFRNEDLSNALEEQIIEDAIAEGIMPYEAFSEDDGLLVGNWTDWLDLLIERMPQILQFISQLISLFSLF